MASVCVVVDLLMLLNDELSYSYYIIISYMLNSILSVIYHMTSFVGNWLSL